MTTVSSFVGLASGPLLVGALSDWLQVNYAEDALRYSLLVPTAAPLISTLICALGAGTVRSDLARLR